MNNPPRPMRMFGGRCGYGYKPDPEGYQATSARHFLAKHVGDAELPKSFSLRQHIPAIFDQGNTSTCTGQATGGAIATSFAAKGTPIDVPSRMLIYTLGRCIDRKPNMFGDLPALIDDGAMPNQVMRGLQEWGIVAEKNYPFSGQDVNAEPDLLTLEVANVAKLTGFYRIDSHGLDRRNDFKKAIVNGYPVTFGVDVDQRFEDYDGSALLSAPDWQNLLGGHYLYAIGYETTTSGKLVLEFVNSWGTGWGRSGLGYGDEDFLEQVSDAYVMNLSKVAP